MLPRLPWARKEDRHGDGGLPEKKCVIASIRGRSNNSCSSSSSRSGSSVEIEKRRAQLDSEDLRQFGAQQWQHQKIVGKKKGKEALVVVDPVESSTSSTSSRYIFKNICIRRSYIRYIL